MSEPRPVYAVGGQEFAAPPSGLKAPFPYFGGKAVISAEVWRRFGDTPNYIEPFCGSAVVLLGRPATHHWPRIETVNDYDAHLANTWRAIQAAPEEVARYADRLVSELDLHAIGDWLYYRPSARKWVERLRSDPDYYDAKSAGWWVWFVSCWIGALPSVPSVPETDADGKTAYGQGGEPNGVYERRPHLGSGGGGVKRQKPHLGTGGMGVNRQKPHLGSGGGGVKRQKPHLGTGGRGVNRQKPHLGSGGGGVKRQKPHLGTGGRGVNRTRPHLGGGGHGNGINGTAYTDGPGTRRESLTLYMHQLAARLERVRVCCGDWTRVMGPIVTYNHGLTAIFIDPPYSAEAGRDNQLYSAEDLTVAHDARAWAIKNGDNPLLRIALCGYRDEGHEELLDHGWQPFYWKASGGYGNQGKGRGRENAKREVCWFSPHCLNTLRPLAGKVDRNDYSDLFARANGNGGRE